MDAEARAGAAMRLVDDPMLAEALANIRLAAIKAFEGSPMDADRERLVARITVGVVGRIEAELQSIIDNGLIAAKRVQNPFR